MEQIIKREDEKTWPIWIKVFRICLTQTTTRHLNTKILIYRSLLAFSHPHLNRIIVSIFMTLLKYLLNMPMIHFLAMLFNHFNVSLILRKRLNYEVNTLSFQTFFVQEFKIVQDTWKFSMLLTYILWDDWPIFMIWASNEQLQQQLEYTLLKPDCQSWWFSKMQWSHLEERYAIKFCFKLRKNTTETYGMLRTAFRPPCMNRASFFKWNKRFKEGRDSMRYDEGCKRSKQVNRPELIGQRVWVRVTLLRF